MPPPCQGHDLPSGQFIHRLYVLFCTAFITVFYFILYICLFIVLCVFLYFIITAALCVLINGWIDGLPVRTDQRLVTYSTRTAPMYTGFA